MQIRRIISSVLIAFTICCTQIHGRCSLSSQGDYSPNRFACTGQELKPGKRWTALKGGQAAAQEAASFVNSSKLHKPGCQGRDQELWSACSDRLKIRQPKQLPFPAPSTPLPWWQLSSRHSRDNWMAHEAASGGLKFSAWSIMPPIWA